jgi:hypothetical protein
MRILRIVVKNSNANIDKASSIPFNADTTWIDYRILGWARGAYEGGDRPGVLEFCDERFISNIEERLNRLGLSYYREIREDFN